MTIMSVAFVGFSRCVTIAIRIFVILQKSLFIVKKIFKKWSELFIVITGAWVLYYEYV